MDPLFSPEERLVEWRKFRKWLTELSLEDQLDTVASWWSKSPITSRVIDPYTPETWPNVWELVHSGKFCKSGISIGIEQTLLLSNKENESKIELWLIDDNGQDIYLIVVVNQEYVLNYNHNQVDQLKSLKNYKIISKFKFDGKDHKNI